MEIRSTAIDVLSMVVGRSGDRPASNARTERH